MPISYTQRVSVPENVLFREVGDEAALVNLNESMYFGLDDVGTSMWKALTTSSSIQEACDALLEEYEVEPAVLQTELNRLLEELMEHGLLKLDN